MKHKFLLYKFGIGGDTTNMMETIAAKISQTDDIPVIAHPAGGILIVAFETSMMMGRIDQVLKDAGVTAYMLIDPTPSTFTFNLPDEILEVLKLDSNKSKAKPVDEGPKVKTYREMSDSELKKVRDQLIATENYEELVKVREELSNRNIN